MDLEKITLSEVSQRNIISLICGIYKNYSMYKTNRSIDAENKDVVTKGKTGVRE